MIKPAGVRFGNPFPGLRPFTEEEESLFFGREHQADAMIDKLSAARLLAVVGTSGSGKTSLVNCGLRPGLHRGLMASAGSSWRIVQFRPGSRPLENLICALSEHGALYRGYDGPIPVEELIETSLKLSRHGLVDAFRKARLPQGENLLIVVDQFEELFRYRTAEGKQLAERERNQGNRGFINLLLEAKQQTAYPIYVVLTMRSDFLGNCAEFAELPEAMNEGQYLVPRMTRSEQRAAIEGPVRIGGAEISTVLLTRLVNDVDDNPDQLPILQHALHRTWERWAAEGRAEGSLQLRHYEAVGTMAHALDQHAEEAFGELRSPEQARRCERIFKALTDKGTDARGTRRPTRFGRLCSLAEATPAEVMEVLEVFRHPDQSFLLPPAPQPIVPDSVIDISHESLMRVWERLKVWVEEEAASAQIYRRLADAAALHGAGAAALWRDPDLQVGLAWREKQEPNATWAEQYSGAFEAAMAFLDSGKKLRQRELDEAESRSRIELERAQREVEEQRLRANEQRQRAEEQARSAKRLRVLAFGMALCVLAAVLAAGAAIRSGNAATKFGTMAKVQEALADSAKTRAEKLSRFLSGTSEGLRKAIKDAEGERAQAERYASQANAEKVEADKQTVRAQHEALRNYAHEIAAESTGIPDSQSQLKLLLGLQAVSTTYEPYRTFEKEALESLERAISSAEPRPPTPGHVGDVLTVALSHDGSLVATGGKDGSVRIWDASSGVCLRTMIGSEFPSPVQAVSFSADGQWVASGGMDKVVRVWSVLDKGKPPFEFRGHSGAITDVVFSPGGKQLASASLDKTVKVWDRISSSGEPRTLQISSAISAVSFSPEGKLGTASEDGVARVWDLARAGNEPLIMPLKADPATNPNTNPTLHGTSPSGRNDRLPALNTISFSSDGSSLATADVDGRVAIYDPATGTLIRDVTTQIKCASSVVFSPQGVLLASTGTAAPGTSFPCTFDTDGVGSPLVAARVWNLTNGEGKEKPISLYPGGSAMSTSPYSHRVCFSADGKRVATAGSDGIARVWDAGGGQELLHLSNVVPTQRVVGLSNDGRLLAAVGSDGRLRLFDVESGQPTSLEQSSPKVSSINFLYFTPGERFVAGFDISRVWHIWNTVTGKQVQAFKRNQLGSMAALSPDGKTLASVTGTDASLRNVATGEIVPAFKVNPFRNQQFLLFSPDGAYLATPNGERGLDIFDAAPPFRRHTPIMLESQITSFNFSPDSKRMVTASRDGLVRVWDAVSSKEAEQLRMTADNVYGLSFNASGTAVAILSHGPDGQYDLNVWDPIRQENTLSLRLDDLGSRTGVSRLRMAFDAAGDLLVTDSKMTLHRYPQSIDRWIRLARLSLQRSLRPDECMRYLHGSGCPTEALAQADVAARNSDFNAAELNFRKAKQDHPELLLEARQEVSLAEANALIASGMQYGSLGDFAKAEESYRTALLTDPELHISAQEAASYISIPVLLMAGQNLARNGRLGEAEARFTKARQLDSGLLLDPSREAAKWAAHNALARGVTYADWGDVVDSRQEFDEAARVGLDLRQGIADLLGADCLPSQDNSLSRLPLDSLKAASKVSDSELEAKCIVADGLFGPITRLMADKEVNKAAELSDNLVASYTKVQDADPKKGSRGEFFNNLCFQAARQRNAKPVLKACDKSIELSTMENLPGNRDSRGLARALTGDFKGAIEDFQYFVDHYQFSGHPEYKQQREKWLAELRKGKDPFTDSELQNLQNQ